MTYQFARINLAQTHYNESVSWRYLKPTADVCQSLDEIYRAYCVHKRFVSVMPMFHSRYQDPMADIIGYYDHEVLVAWSLIRRYDAYNALCDQFAWTYHDPKMRLGIETMKTECAIYKAQGFHYLYLEQAHLYKSEIDGFELLGPGSNNA
jgi:hypothetical protein